MFRTIITTIAAVATIISTGLYFTPLQTAKAQGGDFVRVRSFIATTAPGNDGQSVILAGTLCTDVQRFPGTNLIRARCSRGYNVLGAVYDTEAIADGSAFEVVTSPPNGLVQ